MKTNRIIAAIGTAALLALGACSGGGGDGKGQVNLLNVSYDPTRELYRAVDAGFAADWKAKTGQTVNIRMSHGGSGKQSRAVIDGLEADVVTLALAYDIDTIAEKTGKLPPAWQARLPDNSAPYYSTIGVLVRKANPKNIRDWGDLVRPGVKVITPNPKTSGGARWTYLAAWGYGRTQGGDAGARAYVTKLFNNVPVLDSGARGATTTFVERGLGDVLIAWENEAQLARQEMKQGQFDIVAPSLSILAEPPVAVVDANAKKHGTVAVAKAYLDYLYTAPAQEMIAKAHYRPRDAAVAAKYAAGFPQMKLLTIGKDFGGWKKAQADHFADGAIFDAIFAQRPR
ncbi:MAG: sulfate ABC transporter substrate-binding protein [Sphingomonas sp.]